MMSQRERFSFYAQALISVIVLLFCLFNLTFHNKKRQSNDALYSGILNLIIGFWLPSPASGRQNQVDISSQETNVFPKS